MRAGVVLVSLLLVAACGGRGGASVTGVGSGDSSNASGGAGVGGRTAQAGGALGEAPHSGNLVALALAPDASAALSVALTGSLSARLKCSSGSATWSASSGISIVLLVSPGAKVSVPARGW